MYFIKTDDTELPTPYYYSVTSKDITGSDSGRYDETGIVHRNRVRSGVLTCDVKWRLPGSRLAALKNALSGEVLEVELLDPSSGDYTELDMYAESFKADFYQQQNEDEDESWWDISCRLVEY
ncbi:MAG: hypothetical protein K5876_00870 [Ruminiclostridium sp.]|nr:hypothetical protein [Ruminiclostridium sp.]